MKKHHLMLSVLCYFATGINAQSKNDSLITSFINKVEFRMIGPATTGGRISDIAVNPLNHSEYYVAAAYGGVWKTVNSGTTFNPIFDNYGVQSIGCLALDPNNTHIIWVGTGENNNQRSVGYGNGLYKSVDGGKSFQNVGLKNSYHIGMITINPKNSYEVWVAAYGPLWGNTGEQGIYHTLDGGKTWNCVLTNKNAGFNEVHIDPNNSNVLYACAHQRRRHEWTYLGGGPESAIYKSVDKGKTWEKIQNGLPTGDKGRISLVVAKNTPGLLTAVVETQGKSGGVFISTDFGASWTKSNDYFSSGNYYQEVFQDPSNDSRLFFMDTYLHFSEDGGKTVKRFPENNKHVDNHAIWINPQNYKHMRVGCDGGLYETFDYGTTWCFKDNLPITQFYRVSTDNAKPFYNIYGGTQDNYSIGGPSRNNTANGIANEDWFVTVGGDGFKSQIDPNNPNIVYSQWQYGGLIRFDKTTGDQVDIKPRVANETTPIVWNWDAPLIISKYNSSKLYFAANRLFVSENRGDSWKEISGVLGRKIDRNKLPVMDKVWGLDAVAKNQSTSIYGNITVVSEGKKGELFIGTDDGLVYKTNDDGNTWIKIEIPKELGLALPLKDKTSVEIYPLVTDIEVASDGTCYIAFDNHRQGDFKPLLYKIKPNSAVCERLETGIPTNNPIKTLWIDPVDNDILCVGTEFGLYISYEKGERFKRFGKNLPPIAIKDIDYQKESKDLILATFGRGFAICDDYHLIREMKSKSRKWINAEEHALFVPYEKVGGKGNGYRGSQRFQGTNLSEKLRLYVYIDKIEGNQKDQRKTKEKKDEWFYPTTEEIRKEHEEIQANYLLKVRSSDGIEISTIKVSLTKGWNLINWDCRYGLEPLNLDNSGAEIAYGPYVSPGKYVFSLLKYDAHTGIIAPVESGVFGTTQIEFLYKETDLIKLDENRTQNWNDIKGIRGQFILTHQRFNETRTRLNKAIEIAAWNTKWSEEDRINLFHSKKAMNMIQYKLLGGDPIEKYQFAIKSNIQSDFFNLYSSMVESLQAPTKTHLETAKNIEIDLQKIQLQIIEIEDKLMALEKKIQ